MGCDTLTGKVYRVAAKATFNARFYVYQVGTMFQWPQYRAQKPMFQLITNSVWNRCRNKSMAFESKSQKPIGDLDQQGSQSTGDLDRMWRQRVITIFRQQVKAAFPPGK